MTPDDCEDCCSAVCCSTVGYVCCCRKMQKSSKIKVLWAWLIVLACTSGVILYCAVYAPNNRLASPSDMIAVQDHISFLFCEELKIKSPGIQINGYLINGELKYDERSTKQTSQSTAMFVSARNYDYFAFYFLKGSSMTIKHCSKEFLTLYVIIGSKNFDAWKQYQNCDDCYFEQIYVYPKFNCTEDQYSTFELDVLIEEEYFIIYSNNNYKDVWVDLFIDIDRRVYDLDNATSVCTETTECDLFLESPKQVPLFWVMDYYNLGEHNHPMVATECVPRIWAFLVIHGLPVLLIGISVTIYIQRTHRTPNEYNRITERTPLLYDAASPPSYSTVMRDPPKYEDILRTCDPPPYTEVIAALQSTPVDSNQIIYISQSSLTGNSSQNFREVNETQSTTQNIVSTHSSLSEDETDRNGNPQSELQAQTLDRERQNNIVTHTSDRININISLGPPDSE